MNTFWMSAKRDGECAECEIELAEGDRIVYDSEAFKAYCSICGEEVAGQDPASRSYIK